jgi:hypothetical protein
MNQHYHQSDDTFVDIGEVEAQIEAKRKEMLALQQRIMDLKVNS